MSEETIEDIVAEIRRDIKLGNNYYAANLPDRIEAAAKREREAVEADALAVGGIVEAARHSPGNAAEMREALEPWIAFAEWLLENAGKDKLGEAIRENGPIIRQRMEELRAALSAPPRNCDVGSPEEQEKRWHKNCGHGIPNCKHCKVYGQAKESGFVSGRGFLLSCSCKFVWAQMPYEAQEGAAK